VWANRYGFLGTREETLKKYPGFKLTFDGKISTKPPIIFVEGYNLDD
jgi:hypothetical protein